MRAARSLVSRNRRSAAGRRPTCCTHCPVAVGNLLQGWIRPPQRALPCPVGSRFFSKSIRITALLHRDGVNIALFADLNVSGRNRSISDLLLLFSLCLMWLLRESVKNVNALVPAKCATRKNVTQVTVCEPASARRAIPRGCCIRASAACRCGAHSALTSSSARRLRCNMVTFRVYMS